MLRLLYSSSLRPKALAKVLGVPDGEVVDKLRSLKEKVRLFLASTG
jgi:sugar-specific transcriptional regulator TrmB